MSLEVEFISVCSFYEKLVVWENSGKNVGINFNLYKVYFVVYFPFMVCVNNKVY